MTAAPTPASAGGREPGPLAAVLEAQPRVGVPGGVVGVHGQPRLRRALGGEGQQDPATRCAPSPWPRQAGTTPLVDQVPSTLTNPAGSSSWASATSERSRRHSSSPSSSSSHASRTGREAGAVGEGPGVRREQVPGVRVGHRQHGDALGLGHDRRLVERVPHDPLGERLPEPEPGVEPLRVGRAGLGGHRQRAPAAVRRPTASARDRARGPGGRCTSPLVVTPSGPVRTPAAATRPSGSRAARVSPPSTGHGAAAPRRRSAALRPPPGTRRPGRAGPAGRLVEPSPGHAHGFSLRDGSAVPSFCRRVRSSGSRWALPCSATYRSPKAASSASSRRRTAPGG